MASFLNRNVSRYSDAHLGTRDLVCLAIPILELALCVSAMDIQANVIRIQADAL